MVPKNEQVSRNRASITDGSPRRSSQVPRGSSIGAVAAMPGDAEDGDHGLGRPAELEVVGAPLQGARGRRDEHPEPGCPRVLRGGRGWTRRCPRRPLAICQRRAKTRAKATTTGSTTSQNTQRHDQVVVTHAATGGPSSEGSTQAAEMTLNTLGRNDSG